MRGSLDDLIRFLLEEIALCGEQGARPADVLNYITAYYEERAKTRDGRATVIDRPFQEQVWKWLTRHPEILVGRENQGNELSLSEVEARNKSDTQRNDTKAVLNTAEQSSSGEAQNAPSVAAQASKDHDARSSLPPLPTLASQGLDSVSSPQPELAPNPQDESFKSTGLHVYTSQNRMWLAAAGHAPDPSRIPRLDFILLSIIAARRDKGILQPDLVRVSGQDKRSVPKRTERLHETGYIEKKAVHIKGNRTSICILKRFADSGAASKRTAKDEGGSEDQNMADRTSALEENLQGSVVEVEVLSQAILDIVRPVQIMTWDNMKTSLGVWRRAWHQRLAATAVRRLEMLGCVKRVRATGNYKRPGQTYYRCVKYIRDLEPGELKMFVESQHSAADSLKVGDGDDVDAEGEDDEDYLRGGVYSESSGTEVQKLELQEVGRIAPRWIAGQSIPNFLQDLVHSTGTKGISTMDLKSLGFGEYFSRPLEHQLSRLVDLWQLSQPPHIRHLAIIRDTALTKRIAHYTHYSFDNFQALVDSGKASWEAVEVVTDTKKKNKTAAAAEDQGLDVDEYGFSKMQASRFQGRNNDATLLECVLASGAKSYSTPLDSVARKMAGGTYSKAAILAYGTVLAPTDFFQGIQRAVESGLNATPAPIGSPHSKEPSKPKLVTPKPATRKPAKTKATKPKLATPQIATLKATRSSPATIKPAAPNPAILEPTMLEPAMSESTASNPITPNAVMSKSAMSEPTMSELTASFLGGRSSAPGRPRKYPAVGTPANMDKMSAQELKKLRVSQERAAYYVRKKRIAEEVAKRVEAGEDPLAAKEAVLVELAPPKKEKQSPAVEKNTATADSEISTPRPVRKRKRKASVQTEEALEENTISLETAEDIHNPPINLSEGTTLTNHGDRAIAAALPNLLSTANPRQLDAAVKAVTAEDQSTNSTDISLHPSRKRKKSTKARDNATGVDVTPAPGIRDPKAAGYQALAQDIARIDSGIVVGPHAFRKTGIGRPRKARLAIIRSSRMNELLLFRKDQEPSIEAPKVGSTMILASPFREQPLTTIASARPLIPAAGVQRPIDQPSVISSNYLSPYDPAPKEFSPRPDTDYVSPYAPKTGEKRKRTKSSALETGSSGPRRGFSEKSPLTDASNTKTRSVVPPSTKRLHSQVTQLTFISNGQTAPEHVTEDLIMAAQQETTQRQGLMHTLVQQDNDPDSSIVEPMQDAEHTAPASENKTASGPISIDPAHDRASDSQSIVTGPDLGGDARKPEHGAPVDMTSSRVGQGMSDCPTAPLGDPNPADGNPGNHPLGNEQFRLHGDHAKSPGSTPDPSSGGGNRGLEESRLAGEQYKSLVPIAVDVYLEVIAISEAPSPRPSEEATGEQVSLNRISSQPERSATDSCLFGIIKNPEQTGPTGDRKETSGKSLVDVLPEISTGVSDGLGMPSKGKQPDDSPAQRPGPNVQSQSSADFDNGSPAGRKTPRGGISLMESANNKQVDAESQLDPEDGLPKIIDVHDADENSSVKGSPRKKSSRVITRLTPNSGSIGTLRQKIIMEIVETCGGVFPGDKELWYPFTTAWLQRMPPGTGKPDNRTIRTAKKALIASGKLRQLRFTFLNKHGVMVEKGMITTKEVHSNAPTVKNLQRKMIEQDPWLYIPEEAAVAEDLRRAHATAVVFGTNRTTAQLDVDEETQVELQYVPAYIRRAAMNKEVAAARRRAAAVKRRMQEDKELTTDEKYGAQGKELRKLLGVPNLAINGYRSAEVVMESEKDGTSEFRAFERASAPSVRRPGRPFGSRTNANRPKVQRLARLGGPSQSRPLRSILPRPSSPSTDQSAEAGPLLAAHRLMVKSTAAAGKLALDSSSGTSRRPNQRVDYAAVNRGQTAPREDLRFEIWTPEDSDVYKKLCLTKPLALDSIFNRSPSPDFEVGRHLNSRDRIKTTLELWSPQFHSSCEWQQVSTMMDPDNCFHLATGTYSVAFSVFRNVRLGLDVNTKDQAENKKVALLNFPTNLPSLPFKHNVPDQYAPLSGSRRLFHSEIDDMLLMELNAPNLEPYVSDGLRFINHVMPHPHHVAQRPGRSSTKRSRLAKGLSAWPVKARKNASLLAKCKLIVLKLPAHHLASLVDRPPAPTLVRPESQTRCDADGRPLRRVRVPGCERLSKYMSMTTEKHLMTAVVVIRTLTGGLEGNLDWNLVATLFQPAYGAAFIHNRWASLRIKYRVQIEKMQTDFQGIFASAYEDNLLPPLDFDNIEGYDWAWLVDWTKKQLEFPSPQVLPELPTSRAQLDDYYDMRESKEPDLTDYFFSPDPTHTFVRRQARIQRKPMTVPLLPKSRTPPDPALQLLEVAKTWARANVITLDSNYNPSLAHQKLVSLPESLISTALQSLLSDRTIARVEKGRLVPGRNYSLSESFFTRLKSSLPVPQLQRAAQYKLSLDRSFAAHGSAELSYHADDGDMVALMNLVAHRRVTLVPRDAPMKPFGLVDGGYKTRFMDKSRLTFSVDIFPTPTYIPGLPTLPPPPVPQSTDPNDPGSRLPVWIDIHEHFVQEMWDLALAAVLGLVVLRPGMGLGEVVEKVAGCLGEWEVEALLAWLVKAGVAEWVEGGRGVRVGEGWWGVVGRLGEGWGMVIGEGVGKGKGKEREGQDGGEVQM